MDPATIYRELRGSGGDLHLQLSQAFLDRVCLLFEHQEFAYVGKIKMIRITPDKKKHTNLFRIQVEMSRTFLQDIGEILLNTFSDGLEIQIDQTCATPADPKILASFETRAPGINLAETLVKEINNALKADNVIEMETQRGWFDLRPFKAFLTLKPFVFLERLIAEIPALARFVPRQLVDHLTHIGLTTSDGCLFLDLKWQHVG